jgi:transcriptional regulator NrdR
MYCPFCAKEDSKVIDSRLVSGGKQIRRRRECVECAERFTTYEIAELLMPKIIKRSGVRQPFDEEKLRQGLVKATQKRSISTEQLEELVQKIMHRLRTLGEREVSSSFLGELLMEELKVLDQVAYVRFASIYRDFKDVGEFNVEVKKLQSGSYKSD